MDYRFRAIPVSGQYLLFDPEGDPVEDANRFLRAIAVRGLSPKTIRAYGFDLLVLYRWMAKAEKEFGSLTQTDLFDFLAAERDRKANPKSINRRLSVFHLYYRYCYAKEMSVGIRVNSPSPYYTGPGRDHFLGLWRARRRDRLQLRVKVPRPLVEPLKVTEVNRFFRSLSRYRDVGIALLLLLCGLRSSEVLSLELEDIDFINKLVRVHGKGNKERVLPLPESLASALYRYCTLERPLNCKTHAFFVVLQGDRRGSPMTATGLRSLFRHRRRSLNLHRAHAHRFRHTFGADMARAGVRLPILQRLMGHANGSTTLQYIHLSMADIADEYQRVITKIQRRYETP